MGLPAWGVAPANRDSLLPRDRLPSGRASRDRNLGHSVEGLHPRHFSFDLSISPREPRLQNLLTRCRMRILRASGGLLFLAALALSTSLWSSPPQTPVQLKPGDPAPDFSLPGSDGRTYRLADFRGKQAVVLVWFVKAFSGG